MRVLAAIAGQLTKEDFFMQWEFLTALATIASVLVAAWSVRTATRVARESIASSTQAGQQTINVARLSNQILKTVDVSTHCASRSEELSRLRAEIIRLEADEAGDLAKPEPGDDAERRRVARGKLLDDLSDHYFRRFWALKSDQFDYWLYGVLDHDTFYDWSYYLVVKILEDRAHPKPSARYNLVESWRAWSRSDSRAGHGGSNPMFVFFTNELFGLPGKLKPHNGYLPRQVLNLIKKLEGTPAEPGFSRRYRSEIWAGQTFEQFETAMLRDFEIRMQQTTDTGVA